MADLTNRFKKVGTNEINSSGNYGNRSETELQIGLNNKSFLDSKFTRLIEAPTMRCEYYQLDSNMSSFSEFLKITKEPKKSLYYNLINNFVMYNLSPSEEIDPKDESERSPIINLSNKTAVILAGTIRPKEGDCVVLHSHSRIKKVFQVSRVDEKLLIDREVYEIQFIESPMWTYEEIQTRITNSFSYLESNVGSGNKVILENNIIKDITKIKSILKDMNKTYVEMFYSELYDCITLKNPLIPSELFTLRSLSKFQMDKGVIRYGFDESMLFINNDYMYKYDDTNYNKSIYKRVVKGKKIKKIDLTDDSFLRPMDKPDMFQMKMKEFERYCKINNEDRDLEELHECYYIDLYYRCFENHMVMTNLFNSGLRLTELIENNPFLYETNNNNVVKPYRYYLNNSFYSSLIDKYYEALEDKDNKGFKFLFDYIKKSYITLMEDYDMFNNDLNDMIFFPIIKYIIELTINEITKDEMITSY